MTNQLYDPKVTETLQTVAELIALKPRSEWMPWMQFFLNELKSVLPAQSYADLLAQLQEETARQMAELAG